MKKTIGLFIILLGIIICFSKIELVYSQQEVSNLQDHNQSSISFFEFVQYDISVDEKLPIAELMERMPESIFATFSDGTKKDISVVWNCVEDYNNSDFCYYSFKPTFLEEYNYAADILLPYVIVWINYDYKGEEDDAVFAASLKGNSNEEKIYYYLVENMGLNTAAVCGILSNIKCESNFNPTATGDNGTSYGICQWHNDRWTNLKNYCNNNGYSWQALEGQLHFLESELNSSQYRYILNAIAAVNNNADGAYDAGYVWCYEFERPANKASVSETRGNVARNTYWPKYGGGIPTPIPPDPANDFVFHLDLPAGSYSGSNNIEISGWLASNKDISYAFYQIENVVQVQMGLQDEQGVKDANPGYAYGKRFRGVIEIGKLSSNTTYALGIWLGFADGSQTGVQTSTFSTGTISHETPTGYNLQVTDQSTAGYTISCNFNGTMKEIRFATWTDQNGQDDIKWLNGTISGNTVSCRINTSDHNNEKNCVYWTHIYAYDSNDNPYFLEGTGVNIETTPPVIKNIAVAGDQDGYTVTCQVSDAGSGIDRVQFPTWTTANGQDDIQDGWGNSPAASGVINNGKVTFRVNRSDHNNEWGQYVTHIYAYDKCGNYTSEGTSFLMENTPPKITNVQVAADAEGYTVTCDVSDAGSGIDRVQFPTWTLANSQDDIQQGWNTSPKVRGTLSNGKATFRVNRSDHNNEYGTYRTHIYCFDKCQNYTYYHVPDIKYEYTVRFDANGGDNIPENMKKYLGTDLLLPDNVPVRPGYIFTGYGTSVEGEAEYQPGDLITADEDITLYALWNMLEPDAVLPVGLLEIGEEAFAGCGFVYIVIPEGTTAIKNRAFQNCSNLKIVRIPESVTSIAADAFDAVSERLTIFGDTGSYAEFYANKHGFSFQSE